MRRWARVFGCGAFAVAASSAGAKAAPAPGVYKFPSADIPNVAALRAAVQNSGVQTIVVAKGDYDVGSGLFVAERDDLVVRGATGNPKDVVLRSSTSNAVAIEAARHVTFSGVTLSTSAPFTAAVFVDATPSASVQSYAEDVVLDRCALSGYEGVLATVGAKALTVTRCSFTLTGSGSPAQGGAGIVWGDGPDLFVGRSSFRAASGVPAVAGVLVQGALAANADGGRASGIVLAGDDVAGDFAFGFDLADVSDARLRGNRVSFPQSTTTTALPGVAVGSGRVGIRVRRGKASQLTEDFALSGNRVRGAHYGAWTSDASSGVLKGNDFRACGSSAKDAEFADFGGGVRMDLLGGVCRTSVVGNDLRRLRSPAASPAVVVFPDAAACFVSGAPAETGNHVDKGRAAFGSDP